MSLFLFDSPSSPALILLLGIRGTVRRSTDHHFIHANMDLDLIICEESAFDSTEKPEEIFNIIENFCLGRRRLHLFASDTTLRPGMSCHCSTSISDGGITSNLVSVEIAVPSKSLIHSLLVKFDPFLEERTKSLSPSSHLTPVQSPGAATVSTLSYCPAFVSIHQV